MQLTNLKAIACFGLLALTLGLTSCIDSAKSDPTPTSSAVPATPSPLPTPVAPVQSSSDQQLSEKLIGTWATNAIEGGVAYQIEESFYPRSEFNGTAQVANDNGDTLYVRYSGTWEIKDSYLHYKITSSNLPDLIPIGDLTVNKIVNITDNDYVYIDQYGNQQVYRRVNG